MGHADLHTIDRERWADRRSDEIADHLINGGVMRVAPFWALPDGDRKVPVVADFIAWIHEERSGDADLAHCLYAPNARRIRLFCDYAERRAQMELDRLPVDYFDEVA